MSGNIEIKSQFGYVVGVALASAVIHQGYMSVQVGAARKKYGVKYPTLYADKDTLPDDAARTAYNCVQRGHQNCLENLPSFYALLIVTGLKYPITAAAAGAVYLAGKIAYFKGYSTGDPEKRMWGGFGYLGLFTLVGAAGKIVYDTICK